MSEKAKNIWLWVSAILLAIACTSWLLVQMDTIRWTNRLSTSSAEATKARKAYNTKLNRLRFEVEEDNSRSKNPVLKSVSLQNGSEQLMNTVGSKFFQYMFMFDKCTLQGKYCNGHVYFPLSAISKAISCSLIPTMASPSPADNSAISFASV